MAARGRFGAAIFLDAKQPPIAAATTVASIEKVSRASRFHNQQQAANRALMNQSVRNLAGGMGQLNAAGAQSVALFGAMGSLIPGVTAGVGIAATAFTGFGIGAVQTFARMEEGFRRVATLVPTASEETVKSLERMGQRIRNAFNLDIADVSESAYQALSRGVPLENLEGFLTEMGRFARAEFVTLAEAVNLTQSTMRAFQFDVEDVDKVTGGFAITVNKGATTLRELASEFSRVAPLASSVGLALEEPLSAIALMTAQGIRTPEAATNLRSMLDDLMTLDRGSGKIFSEHTGTPWVKYIEDGGTLIETLDILKGISEETGQNLASMFGRIEAGTGALALTSDLETMQEISDLMQLEGADEVMRKYELAVAGVNEELKTMGTTWREFQDSWGRGLAPASGFFGGAAEGAMDFLDIPEHVRKWTSGEDPIVNFFTDGWNDAADAVDAGFDLIGNVINDSMHALAFPETWGDIAQQAIDDFDEGMRRGLGEAGLGRGLVRAFEEEMSDADWERAWGEGIEGAEAMRRELDALGPRMSDLNREMTEVDRWEVAWGRGADEAARMREEVLGIGDAAAEITADPIKFRFDIGETSFDSTVFKQAVVALGELTGVGGDVKNAFRQMEAQIAATLTTEENRERMLIEGAQGFIDDISSGAVATQKWVEELPAAVLPLVEAFGVASSTLEDLPPEVRDVIAVSARLARSQENLAAAAESAAQRLGTLQSASDLFQSFDPKTGDQRFSGPAGRVVEMIESLRTQRRADLDVISMSGLGGVVPNQSLTPEIDKLIAQGESLYQTILNNQPQPTATRASAPETFSPESQLSRMMGEIATIFADFQGVAGMWRQTQETISSGVTAAARSQSQAEQLWQDQLDPYIEALSTGAITQQDWVAELEGVTQRLVDAMGVGADSFEALPEWQQEYIKRLDKVAEERRLAEEALGIVEAPTFRPESQIGDVMASAVGMLAEFQGLAGLWRLEQENIMLGVGSEATSQIEVEELWREALTLFAEGLMEGTVVQQQWVSDLEEEAQRLVTLMGVGAEAFAEIPEWQQELITWIDEEAEKRRIAAEEAQRETEAREAATAALEAEHDARMAALSSISAGFKFDSSGAAYRPSRSEQILDIIGSDHDKYGDPGEDLKRLYDLRDRVGLTGDHQFVTGEFNNMSLNEAIELTEGRSVLQFEQDKEAEAAENARAREAEQAARAAQQAARAAARRRAEEERERAAAEKRRRSVEDIRYERGDLNKDQYLTILNNRLEEAIGQFGRFSPEEHAVFQKIQAVLERVDENTKSMDDLMAELLTININSSTRDFDRSLENREGIFTVDLDVLRDAVRSASG